MSIFKSNGGFKEYLLETTQGRALLLPVLLLAVYKLLFVRGNFLYALIDTFIQFLLWILIVFSFYLITHKRNQKDKVNNPQNHITILETDVSKKDYPIFFEWASSDPEKASNAIKGLLSTVYGNNQHKVEECIRILDNKESVDYYSK